MADHVKAVGARMENGLLNIDLVREIPEAMKPRKIDIGGGDAQWVGEQKEPERLATSQGKEPVGMVKEKEKEPVAA